MQKLTTRLITVTEFEQTPEHKHRIFEVSYKEKGDVLRYYKKFHQKGNVRKYLQNPACVDLRIRLWEDVPDDK